jgi:hypothetical protein
MESTFFSSLTVNRKIKSPLDKLEMEIFNSELRRRIVAGSYDQGTAHQSSAYSQPLVQYGSSLDVHQATSVVHPSTTYAQYQVSNAPQATAETQRKF